MKDPNPFFENMTSSPAETYVRRILRNFVDRDIIPDRRKFDEDWKDHKLIEPALKKIMVDMGFQKALFPAEFGGWNLGQTDYLATFAAWMFEEIARGDMGISAAFGTCFWPIGAIAIKPHVNRRLCAEFAPMFVDSNRPTFAALAMTEPQGGSDIENLEVVHGKTIQTRAELSGDHWIINGHKLWPTNSGGVADLFGVICTTSPGSTDERDLALILVPAGTPGVTQGNPYEKAGFASDKNSDVWFENVRVPSWYRAWGPEMDALVFKEMLALGMMSAAFSLGPMINVYEILYAFCSERTLNGKPLREHDAVAAELADIVTWVDVTRSAIYRLAAMLDRPDLYGPRYSPKLLAKARLTKMFAAEQALKGCEKALDILQAYGADRTWDIEKHWRDLKMGQLYEGGRQLAQMDTARYFFDCQTL